MLRDKQLKHRMTLDTPTGHESAFDLVGEKHLHKEHTTKDKQDGPGAVKEAISVTKTSLTPHD